jgi:hypothetical protein
MRDLANKFLQPHSNSMGVLRMNSESLGKAETWYWDFQTVSILSWKTSIHASMFGCDGMEKSLASPAMLKTPSKHPPYTWESVEHRECIPFPRRKGMQCVWNGSLGFLVSKATIVLAFVPAYNTWGLRGSKTHVQPGSGNENWCMRESAWWLYNFIDLSKETESVTLESVGLARQSRIAFLYNLN